MKQFKIAVLPGDGIGPEVVGETIKVMRTIEKRFSIQFNLEECLIGGAAYDDQKQCLPQDTLKICHAADAVLLGAVGGPQWESIERDQRPEKALLGLRSELGLFANLRPALVFDELVSSSPLKDDVIRGVDLLVVRELTGGLYFGKPRGFSQTEQGMRQAYNTLHYTVSEIERIGHVAFQLAQKRNKRVCSVDKANVLEVSELWRQVMTSCIAALSTYM